MPYAKCYRILILDIYRQRFSHDTPLHGHFCLLRRQEIDEVLLNDALMNLTALESAYSDLGSGDALISCDDPRRVWCLHH